MLLKWGGGKKQVLSFSFLKSSDCSFHFRSCLILMIKNVAANLEATRATSQLATWQFNSPPTYLDWGLQQEYISLGSSWLGSCLLIFFFLLQKIKSHYAPRANDILHLTASHVRTEFGNKAYIVSASSVWITFNLDWKCQLKWSLSLKKSFQQCLLFFFNWSFFILAGQVITAAFYPLNSWTLI